MKHLARISLLASCLGLLAGAPASAWEAIYGPAASMEGAAKKVVPVPACGGVPAGYIAVGTQDPGAAGGNANVYVVRTNVMGNPGAPAWEATYDVQNLGQPDEGMAIVPVPGGYVFLSNSWNGALWRPALTMINCLGNVLWSQIYVDVIAPGQSLRGHDLIRTQTGNTAVVPPTNAGDLAVAGVWWNGANDDAFLMRVNAGGNLIWNIAHNTGLSEHFNSLAEALPVAPETAGDLVAVGQLKTTAGDQQALVARVNGNNGVIGAAPQCMQHHGATGSAEVYNSVKRLVNFFPGQFVFAGTTTSNVAAGWLDDVWVTRGNTCALMNQARFGNSGGITAERGNDIIEVLVAKPGAPVGSLAIAGDHKGNAGLGYEASLMLLSPGLTTLAGQHRLFGDFGPNAEAFFSLAEDPAGWPVPPGAGYILAGITRTPWIVADPQDMYLVHDDPAVIACEQLWNPTRVTTGFPQANLLPQWQRPARNTTVPTLRVLQLTGQQICAP